MSKRQSVSVMMDIARQRYIEHQKTNGGTAAEFREFVRHDYLENRLQYDECFLEFVDAAANQAWRKKPREYGDDLLTVAGIVEPEFYTRPVDGVVEGEGLADVHADRFEKVSQKFATIDDAKLDSSIKLRKAAQSSSAANRRAEQVDEMVRRAKGNLSTFVRDIAD